MRAAKQVNFISRDFLKYLREMDEIKNELEQYDREEAFRRKVREDRNKEIAINALAEGASAEFVQKITGLDMEAIQTLSN